MLSLKFLTKGVSVEYCIVLCCVALRCVALRSIALYCIVSLHCIVLYLMFVIHACHSEGTPTIASVKKYSIKLIVDSLDVHFLSL